MGVLFSVLLFGRAAQPVSGTQGQIGGQISNGTSHQPVPNLEVRLLVPREGMQQASITSTDARGHFVFGESQINPSSFYLLETKFKGIAYHAPVQFDSSGTATVNLTVYEPTRSDAALRIPSARILVRAEGAKVRVQEEYAVQNSAEPPLAYANSGGTFRFQLSPSASQPTVAVTGLLNMPLPQTPEPGESPGEFFIRYPFKPGVTLVTLAYEADYSSGQLVLGDQVSYPMDKAELYIFPASLSVDSPVFKPAGVDAANGVQKLVAENLSSRATLEFRLSGSGAPSAGPENGQAEEQIKTVPNSMRRLGVPLLACFLLVLVWALGIGAAKEWPRWQERRAATPAQKQLEAKAEALFNSLADLDELFDSGKVAEKKYWRERLELKAKLVAMLKKGPSSLLESYATRRIPH